MGFKTSQSLKMGKLITKTTPIVIYGKIKNLQTYTKMLKVWLTKL